MCSIKRTNNIMSTASQCFLSKGGQTYGQDSDPNISYSGLSTGTVCSVEERTNLWTGQWPNIIFVYNVTT